MAVHIYIVEDDKNIREIIVQVILEMDIELIMHVP